MQKAMDVRRPSLTYDTGRTSIPVMAKLSEPDRKAPLPTEAEMAILQIVWNRGPSTVREVHTALRSRRTGYTTTLKQMQVMMDKGLLKRNERYRSHVYEARIQREQTQLQLTRSLLARAFDGSAKNLVLGALSAQPISGSELAEIRAMLDRFEKEKA
jgi:BlaI family penicillinase repressor